MSGDLTAYYAASEAMGDDEDPMVALPRLKAIRARLAERRRSNGLPGSVSFCDHGMYEPCEDC